MIRNYICYKISFFLIRHQEGAKQGLDSKDDYDWRKGEVDLLTNQITDTEHDMVQYSSNSAIDCISNNDKITIIRHIQINLLVDRTTSCF